MSGGHIINFRPDGSFDGLHTDRTDLSEIGSMEVRRASWVNFNGTSQKWEVRWKPQAKASVFTHESREECLAWEREQLQQEPPYELETATH